jgi:molecular chaperone GrpE
MDTDNTNNKHVPVEAPDDVTYEKYDDSGEDLAQGNATDKIHTLRKKIIELEKEKQSFLDGWQRQKADYVNLKKRTEEEHAELSRFVRETLIADLLPVLESFDMAFANKEAWEKVDSNWRAGVEYIHKQFLETLTGYGLIEVNPIGEVFDPQVHTAVADISTNNSELDHTVAAVVQKGYRVGDKLIRSPRVHVFSFVKQ